MRQTLMLLKNQDGRLFCSSGVNDKLNQTRGTWKLFGNLETPTRQLVLVRLEASDFQENQFRPEDLSFVRTWIDHNVAQLSTDVVQTQRSNLPWPAVEIPLALTQETYSHLRFLPPSLKDRKNAQIQTSAIISY